MSQKKPSPIAVIGVAAMFPDAADLREYWKNIVEGHDAIKPIPLTHWKPEDLFDADPKKPDHTYAKTGGFLKPYDFDPLKFGIAPHAIEATDTTQLLGMVCAHEALIDAGYGPQREFNKERTSCIIGVTGTLELVIPLGARLSHPAWKKALKNAGVADAVAKDVMEDISDSFVPWQENSFPGLLGNVVAGRIASRFDLGGSNAVVDAACASSLAALSMAVMELESGRSDMVITGGMDTFNDIFMYMCFSKTPALSPTGHSRPFDANGDGTAIGEGLGAVILKRLEDAERDGDRIYAVIKGVGSGSDGKGQAIYAPAAKGQVKALTRAYELADVAPETVELLEAHGTGTKVGDGVEISALAQVYGQSETKHCVIGSVKSQIGHTKAAAGAAGLIKAVMALHHKVQPPTLKVRELHQGLAGTPFQVLDEARPWIPRGDYPRRAAVSAFGFGGSNFHCVVEEYKGSEKPVLWDDEVFLFAYSGESREAISRKLAAFDEGRGETLHILARQSRAAFRSGDPHRLSFVAKGLNDLKAKLKAAADTLESGVSKAGVLYRQGAAESDLSLVFSGQGSQSVGMLRELMLAFPESLEPLTRASEILAQEEGEHGLSLVDYIYPSQAFGEERKLQQKALTATRVAQLALGSVGAALVLVLKRFGVKATQFAGHSYGELLALYAAGSLKLDDLLSASYRRGLLMEKAGKEKGGAGMLAVMSSAETVLAVLKDTESSAVIANFNSPEQVVVGGELSELERLKASLKERGIGAKALEVSTAFHTEFVSGAAAGFDAWLKSHVIFNEPQAKVFGNKKAAAYSLVDMRETLSRQLAAPVRFHEMLKSMKAEIGTLVEIGPGRKILGLLKAVNPEALALDSDAKSSFVGFAQLLGELAVRGHEIDLNAWHPGVQDLPQAAKKSFTVSLTGANYRSPAKPKPAVAKKPLEAASPRDITGAETLAHMVAQTEAKTGTLGTADRDATRRSLPVASRDRSGPANIVEAASPAREVPILTNTIIVTKTRREAAMTKNDSWSSLENILREMQEAQRRTTDAHTLFLENQRQFQSLLREALLGGQPLPQKQNQSAPRVEAPESETPRFAPPSAPRTEPSRIAAQAAPVVAKPAASPVASQRVEVNTASSTRHDILKLIGEATGFPVEMLAEEMHLESDLGIDSIKKVEIFSQLQSRNPQIKSDASQMNEAQTILDLIEFAGAHSFAPAVHQEKEAEDRQGAWSASPVAFASGKSQEARASVLAVISEKTGFPTEMLQDEMDLEADLGVDSIKKVEIFSALGEAFPHVPFAADALSELHRIEDIIHRIQGPAVPKDEEVAATASFVDYPLSANEGDQDLLWAVISEKTGYPAEVLNLQMDLESDLGIDSIKRVEILSALSEKRPELKDKPQTEVRTLNDLLILLGDAAPKVTAHPRADDESLAESLLHPEDSDWDLSSKKKSEGAASEVLEFLSDDELVVEQSQDLSQPAVDCWKLKAVAWAETARREFKSGQEIWVADDGSVFAMTLLMQLEERGAKAKLVSLSSVDKLIVPDDLQGVIILTPASDDHDAFRWYKDAYKLLQKAGEQLRLSHGFVATVSRLGGEFGLDGLESLSETFAGAIASLPKTLSHEWPEIHVRAIDLGRDFSDNNECASRCLDSILRRGPIEIGVFKSRSMTLKLSPLEASEEAPEKLLEKGDTVLVTGGARGVTAATVRHLAKRYPVRYVIWGRTELPPDEPKELRELVEPAQIKRQLLKMHPELSHPKDLERAYAALASARELKDSLHELRSLGAEVIYEAVDVRDEASVRSHLAQLKSRYPRIKGVIHGAGVLRDKFLVEQSEEELDAVLETKLRILPHFEQLAEEGAGWMIFFSSSTARLGRKGQGAYGLANEVLNRSASYLSSKFGTRVLSFNWGPWDGGMVNANLKKLFASEGLGTIPLAAGAALQTYLLEHRGYGSGEWLVLGEGGDEVLKEHIIHAETILEHRTVSVSEVPVLVDHVIKNHAVVPAALLLEWMASAAAPHFLGKVLYESKEFRVFKGLVLDAMTEVEIEIVATEQDGNHMHCLLRSTNDNGQTRPHAAVRLEFVDEVPASSAKLVPYSVNEDLVGFDPYESTLFHGESLQLVKSVKHSDAHRLVAELRLAGEAKDWFESGKDWLVQAPLLDAVFQGAIIWCALSQNSRCLPSRFEEARFHSAWAAQDAILDFSIVSASAHHLKANARVFNAEGTLIAEILGFEATLDASLAESFARKDLAVDDLNAGEKELT